MPRKRTKAEIISAFRDVHGDKFDYSNVVYKNTHTKVKIICRKHGEFAMSPTSHIHQRQQCPACANEQKAENMTLTTNKFVDLASLKHPNLFDYSLVDYVNMQTPVTIICPHHGKFQQKPNHHIHSSAGCPLCANKNITSEMFVERANQIHSTLYDYSQVQYTLTTTPVTIICHRHGPFDQKPCVHLQGSGCPDCWSSKGELIIEQILLKDNIAHEREKRFSSCRSKLPLPFDFWLMNHNILIEYDGEVHFKYIKHIHKTEANFIRMQKHDQIKSSWAASRGIKLIRVRYDQVNEAADLILSEL
jgi:hypothetical protein